MLLIVLPYSVSAFGVTSPYWDENPLSMSLGQTKNVDLILQNMVGDEDMLLEATLESGSEIASLTDENLRYEVPFGRKDILVGIVLVVPEDASIGDEYSVAVKFRQIALDDGGMVRITGAVTKTFPVHIDPVAPVAPEPELAPTTEEGSALALTMWIIIAVLIAVSIAVFVIRRRIREGNIRVSGRQ